MSEFWELWNRAEAGDVEAAQQVNVLVAKRNGYRVELNMIPVIDMDKQEIIERRACWRLYKSDGSRASENSYKGEEFAWLDVPDYMNDLGPAMVGAWWTSMTGEAKPK